MPDPATTELKDAERTIECWGTSYKFTDPCIVSFARALDAFNERVPLVSLAVEPTAENDWSYSWQTQGGKTWNQALRRVPGVDWEMTFSVADHIRYGDFIAHRPVRDAVCVLLEKGITKIEVSWY